MNIHTAARNGNLNRVRTLLNQGVPVNSRNWSGRTPLHEAAGGGHVNIVKELLRRGAHVNPRTPEGSTPLKFGFVHPHVAHALIKAGAKTKYRNEYGRGFSNFPYNKGLLNALKTSRAATKWQNFRKKSIASKRASLNALAPKVFSPNRIRKMINEHGINYLNKV
jgi:ankyrin repeat protein